ncbi:MAG: mechanosensitive ion channel [Verrucomicrobiae bacterium]|nr:mechanosensitive ion channel [Verrucomicrobiae bacterium]
MKSISPFRHLMDRLVLCFFAFGLTGIVPAAQAQDAGEAWTGTWETRWRGGGAVLHLDQNGKRVSGTYPLYSGSVEATVEGRELTGRWTEASGRTGAFLFSLSPDGNSFMGRFDSGEWWTGKRLSGSHEFVVEPPNLSSPRETLRSFLRAANASRSGFFEEIRPALDAINFANSDLRSKKLEDSPMLPQERINYARILFDVLDELTFRLWEIPGSEEVALTDSPKVTVTIEQIGTEHSFDMSFVRHGESWLIDPPSPVALVAELAHLYERRGGLAPATREHLQLRNPRDTFRTFVEEMEHFDDGGADLVLRTMDLAGLGPAVQKDEAALMAQYLGQIVGRIGSILYQEIPNHPDERNPYVHFQHVSGDIVIAPYPTEEGVTEWRFTAETLRHLRSLYAAIEDMPIALGAVPDKASSAYFAVREVLRKTSPSLLHRFGPLEGWQWLSIAFFLVTSIFLAWLLTAVALRLVERRQSWALAFSARRARLALVWPLRITFVGCFWYLKVDGLGLPEIASAPVRGIAATLAIAAGVWLIYRGLGLAGDHSNRALGTAGQHAVLTSLIFGVLRILVIVAGALMIADAWSLPYTGVLAGLGIGGLAFALAAQPTLQNMISGFTLYADCPLSVGDFCRYGDRIGTVEQIGLRSTRIRSPDRTVVSIPNSEFANLQLENFAKRDRMLFRTTLGLRYETTPDQLRFVLAELRRLLIAHPKVDPDPARIRFAGIGAYSLDVEAFAYVATSDWNEFLAIREDIYLRILDIVAECGTGFAFPSQTNYLARDHGTDPGLTKQAESTVARWREMGDLPFPHFPEDVIGELSNRLDYPPKGSNYADPNTENRANQGDH